MNQFDRIQKIYRELKEEKIVTDKDVAFHWIFEIAQNYDGANTTEEYQAVIDELAAYAMLGKESIE